MLCRFRNWDDKKKHPISRNVLNSAPEIPITDSKYARKATETVKLCPLKKYPHEKSCVIENWHLNAIQCFGRE